HVPCAHRALRLQRDGSEEAGAEEPGPHPGRLARRRVGRAAQPLLRRAPMKIEIDAAKQELRLLEGKGVTKRYPVSTANRGLGEKNGSLCTPRGRHIVR